MDSVATLLDEARTAGLTVRADGDQLVIRGPRAAAGIVHALIAQKSVVLAALAGQTDDHAAVLARLRGQRDHLVARLEVGWAICANEVDPIRRTRMEDHWIALLRQY